jgi:hypothetical protein
MASYTPPNEKADFVEAEMGNSSGHPRKGEVDHIGALATAPGTTLDSFSHLDEKKILRKVCLYSRIKHQAANFCVQMDMRLIPMLALLYLLSFLDRKSTLNNTATHH